MAAIDSELFRDIMSGFPAGVTVVTAMGEDGRPYGLTVSAFCSVSLNPPLVLVCVEKSSTSLPAIQWSRAFTVNFLAQGQGHISDRFASKEDNKFDGLSWSPPTTPGAGPVLVSGITAAIECSVHQAVEAGDHWIFVGEVQRGSLGDATQPLVHWHRQYLGLRQGSEG